MRALDDAGYAAYFQQRFGWRAGRVRRVSTVEELFGAADQAQPGDTLLVGGSGGGHAVPEALLVAIERRLELGVDTIGIGGSGSNQLVIVSINVDFYSFYSICCFQRVCKDKHFILSLLCNQSNI